jgi:hypothetical protein
MRRRIYLGKFPRNEWPSPKEMKPYFIEPESRDSLYVGGNDSWGLKIFGLYGTENLKPYVQDPRNQNDTAVEAGLGFWLNPQFGTLLAYS